MVPSMMDLRCLSGILEKLRLSLVQVEEWILIQRMTFDLRIDEEPYHSVQVYANMETRKYVVRVWGRTSDKGEFKSDEELRSLCVTNFENTSACVGVCKVSVLDAWKNINVNTQNILVHLRTANTLHFCFPK